MWRIVRRWFRLAITSFRVEQVISAAEQRASKYSSRINHSVKRLKRIHRQLEGAKQDSEALVDQWRIQFQKMQRRISILSESAMEDLEDAERLQNQYEETIDGLRSELTVLRETTVPSLVASNKLVLSELDAWTAVQVRRQVASMSGVNVE